MMSITRSSLLVLALTIATALLVIDHATWERAQPAAAAFEKRPDVPIRGRRETQDVYALAMPS